jgi:hypothetical protein
MDCFRSCHGLTQPRICALCCTDIRWSIDTDFVSGPGGFFDVCGIRFDPAIGKTVGHMFQVSKFERPRPMIPRWIPPVGIPLTQEKLVSTMAEESGNIWVLDNVDR